MQDPEDILGDMGVRIIGCARGGATTCGNYLKSVTCIRLGTLKDFTTLGPSS